MEEKVYVRRKKALLVVMEDIQFLHLPPQGGAVNSQFFCGFFDLSAVFPEGFEYQFPFKFSQSMASATFALEVRFLSQVRGKMFGTDMSCFA